VFEHFNEEEQEILKAVINFEFKAEEMVLKKQYLDSVDYLKKASLRKKLHDESISVEERAKIIKELKK
jgi:hypothetical protein